MSQGDKGILQDFNKVFSNRVRLGMMSVLMVEEWAEFKKLKELLSVTDGNLASHIAALEKLGYIEVRKQFVGKRPLTDYKATDAGRSAFEAHLNALEQLLNGI